LHPVEVVATASKLLCIQVCFPLLTKTVDGPIVA